MPTSRAANKDSLFGYVVFGRASLEAGQGLAFPVRQGDGVKVGSEVADRGTSRSASRARARLSTREKHEDECDVRSEAVGERGGCGARGRKSVASCQSRQAEWLWAQGAANSRGSRLPRSSARMQ